MRKLRHFAVTRKRFQLIRRMHFFLNWISGRKNLVHYTPKMYRHARTWERLGIFEKLEDMKKRGDSPADAVWNAPVALYAGGVGAGKTPCHCLRDCQKPG